MNLIRLIVIGLIIWLLYRMFVRVLKKPSSQRDEPAKGIARDMVKCAHCGLHIPADEALLHVGKYYCSPEHRDAGPAQKGN